MLLSLLCIIAPTAMNSSYITPCTTEHTHFAVIYQATKRKCLLVAVVPFFAQQPICRWGLQRPDWSVVGPLLAANEKSGKKNSRHRHMAGPLYFCLFDTPPYIR